MSKICSKCNKTVYPTEELKCLEKIWHKTCFRCESCGMTLNMKNYKGFEKLPYCNAHYPQMKFTAVADTPENMRIAENTKLQSQVKYHEDFEKNMKGKKIEVADDPETMRIQQHGKIISQAEYKNVKQERDDMERRRGNLSQEPQPMQGRRQIGSVTDYDPEQSEVRPSPYSSRFQGQSTAYPSSPPPVTPADPTPQQRRVGSIADYDPMHDNWGSLQHGYYPSVTGGGAQEWEETVPQPRAPQQPVRQPYYPPPAQPMPPPPQQQRMPALPQQQRMPVPPQQQRMPAPPAAVPQPPRQPPQMMYQAMYDYDAADEDEVSFKDGDYIINPEVIDEGWMVGTIQRTGQRGMLPANYVERVQ